MAKWRYVLWGICGSGEVNAFIIYRKEQINKEFS